MKSYAKGAKAERELMQLLSEKGFSVMRAAGSAKSKSTLPDVIALKKGLILAFECKNYAADYLYLQKKDFLLLKEFAENSLAKTFIAWRLPQKKWLFLSLNNLNELKHSFGISKKEAEILSISFNELIK